MDAKQAFDAAYQSVYPASHLVPQPGNHALDTVPQTLDQIRADLHDFGNGLCKRLHQARNDLRHSLYDFHNNGGQILNQGDE